MEIRIELDDNGLINSLYNKAGQTTSYFNRFRDKLVQIAYKWVRSEAPKRTGKLTSGIQRRSTSSGGYIFSPKSMCKYVDFVIDGTRPHDIFPKNRRALFWPGARHPVKKVHHPGTKSNPFYDRAYNKTVPEIDREISIAANWLTEV